MSTRVRTHVVRVRWFGTYYKASQEVSSILPIEHCNALVQCERNLVAFSCEYSGPVVLSIAGCRIGSLSLIHPKKNVRERSCSKYQLKTHIENIIRDLMKSSKEFRPENLLQKMEDAHGCLCYCAVSCSNHLTPNILNL